MKEKNFVVYYNDQVNEPAEMFSAETLEECINWINANLEGMMPVDDEHACTDDVFYSSTTFLYEVYEGGIIVGTGEEDEEDEEPEWKDPCYTSGYYYAD